MKLLKSLALGALALAAVSVVSAATTIKITGSTAFRKALYGAIIDRLGAGTVRVGYFGNTALSSANQVTFVKADGSEIVECCMAGSTGGIGWVATGANVSTSLGGPTNKSFIDPANYLTWGTANVAGSPLNATGGTQLFDVPATWGSVNPSPADIAMGDTFQDSTPTDSLTTIPLVDANGGAYCGVVTFTFAKGLKHASIPQANYDRLTNISALGFQALAANGILPLSFFTGNSADAAYDVVLTGRDNDSGTRLVTWMETGYGDALKGAKQYLVSPSATSAPVAVTSLTSSPGLTGYASGGHVKNALNSSIAAGVLDAKGKPFILVGYVGIGDIPGAAAQTLTYEGTPTTTATVTLGQGTFWSYQHLLYDEALVSTPKGNLADDIADRTTNTYAPASGTALSGMTVSRQVEGGVVSPL